MHASSPRYIVGVPSNRVLYEGQSRLAAWLTWLRHRDSGASAYDRRSWIIDPSYWLRGETPPADYFGQRPC